MVTDKIGTVSGYAALFNEPSLNLAKKGEAPRCETIIPGGLTLASNVMLDRHHLGFLAVASTSSRTLRCGFDETGLWFEADLYPQSGGYDVHNALRGGRSLAASFTMIDRRAEREGDLDIVWAATVVGLALLRPGRAVYSGTRAWLADEVPRDAVAARLQSQRLRAGARLIAAGRRAPLASNRGWRAHAMTWDQTKQAAQRLGLL
jgi:Caudovirus prohead serine protease